MRTDLVIKRLEKRPAQKGGYHPNASPYKVIVDIPNQEAFIKREYAKKEKAEKYAMRLSEKHPKWLITIEYIKI